MAAEGRFETLDGLRGVAAIAVAVMHAPELMGGPAVGGAYLAVDLFFMLSGFVIAHAYDPRIARGMTTFEFLRARIIRLYPLFLLGTLAGVLVTAGGLVLIGETHNWTWGKLIRSAPFSLLMLPTPWPGYLYPPNAVGWSLFFELVINLVYVLAWRPLQRPAVLIGAIALSAVALAPMVVAEGHASIGDTWQTFAGGLARASFGFLTGVGLHRLYQRGVTLPPINPWVLFALVLLAFSLPRGPWTWATDIGLIVLAFPVIVAAGVTSRPAARWAPLFGALGAVSYAVYAIHKPLIVATFALLDKVAHVDLDAVSPWSGIAFVAIALTAAFTLDKIYDAPVRRWLGRRTRPRLAT